MRRCLFGLFTLTLLLTLSACRPSQPAETPAPTIGAYPTPVLKLLETTGDIYPAPGGDPSSYTDWSVASQAVLDGRVVKIYQGSTLHVTMVLDDKSVMLVLQPALGEAASLVERCGAPCQAVELIGP